MLPPVNIATPRIIITKPITLQQKIADAVYAKLRAITAPREAKAG